MVYACLSLTGTCDNLYVISKWMNFLKLSSKGKKFDEIITKYFLQRNWPAVLFVQRRHAVQLETLLAAKSVMKKALLSACALDRRDRVSPAQNSYPRQRYHDNKSSKH